MIDKNQPQLNRQNSQQYAGQVALGLVDEMMMTKYGTSLQEGMTREYQKYLLGRYEDLKKEFRAIDKNSDQTISLEELIDFFQKFTVDKGVKFDREYFEHLYRLLDKNADSQITIQEFVFAYVQLEEKLRLKKIKLTKLVEDLKEKKMRFEKKMNQYKDEKITAEGISDHATLFITLIEARDLKPMTLKEYADPYVVFTLENKKKISSYKPETLDPVWNEEFAFLVTKRNAVVKVEVFDRDEYSRDGLQGKISIDLKSLEHQLKSEAWFDLSSEDSTSTEGLGAVRLQVQYIHNRVKYNSDNAIKTEIQIEGLARDIIELNKYLEKIKTPFGIIVAGEITSILQKRMLEKSEDVIDYLASTRRSIYVTPRSGKRRASIARKVENIVRGTFRRKHVQWSKISLLMMYLTVFLSFIVLLDRSDFVNLFLGTAIWIIFIWEKNTDVMNYLRNLILVLLVTLLYDFIWLVLHYSSYWKQNHLEKVSASLKVWVYLISMINLLLKLALSGSLWIHYTKVYLQRKFESQNPPIIMSPMTTISMMSPKAYESNGSLK